MNPPQPSIPNRQEITQVIELITQHANDYFQKLDQLPVRSKKVEETAKSFQTPLPEIGDGASQTLVTLLENAKDAAVNSAGPAFFIS